MNRITLICLACVLASGCSGGDDANSGDHVFGAQTRALDKARSVGQTIDDAATRQRQAIEEQTRGR